MTAIDKARKIAESDGGGLPCASFHCYSDESNEECPLFVLGRDAPRCLAKEAGDSTMDPKTWARMRDKARRYLDEAEHTTPDAVEHPSHYTGPVPGIECIEVTRHFNFNRGNAIKYLWRAGSKDPQKEVEDLRKAAWYIADEIARIEGGK